MSKKKPKKNLRTARVVFYTTPQEFAAAANFAKRSFYQTSVGGLARVAFAKFMQGANKPASAYYKQALPAAPNGEEQT